ncbi:MAG: YicC/YloC family endoribonuclease [Flavobacteriales bacterium]
MIRSMTGYGKAQGSIGQRNHEVEVRSLNSKQLHLKVLLPPRFQDKEIEMRTHVSERISRGKVDVTVSEASAQKDQLYRINKEVLRAHYQDLKGIAEELEDERSELLATAMQIPDVLSYQGSVAEAHEAEDLWKLLKEAMDAFDAFAEREGSKLQEDLEAQSQRIQEGVERIEEEDGERKKQVKERLEQKITEVVEPGDLDKKRFEQELLYYLERLDINEEKTRLRSHLDQFHQVMKEKDPGKKLQFITQEIGREINTIGSKADHAPIQREVVNMKEALERIKEQLMNVR